MRFTHLLVPLLIAGRLFAGQPHSPLSEECRVALKLLASADTKKKIEGLAQFAANQPNQVNRLQAQIRLKADTIAADAGVSRSEVVEKMAAVVVLAQSRVSDPRLFVSAALYGFRRLEEIEKLRLLLKTGEPLRATQFARSLSTEVRISQFLAEAGGSSEDFQKSFSERLAAARVGGVGVVRAKSGFTGGNFGSAEFEALAQNRLLEQGHSILAGGDAAVLALLTGKGVWEFPPRSCDFVTWKEGGTLPPGLGVIEVKSTILSAEGLLDPIEQITSTILLARGVAPSVPIRQAEIILEDNQATRVLMERVGVPVEGSSGLFTLRWPNGAPWEIDVFEQPIPLTVRLLAR